MIGESALSISFLIGFGTGLSIVLGLPGLISGLIGIGIHKILKIRLSWRIVSFLFFIAGEIIFAFFSSLEIFLSYVLVFFFPFLLGVICLGFMTFFELRKTINSNYWCLVLSFFLACLVTSLFAIWWFVPFYAGGSFLR
jgi:hypothetical protein